MAEDAPQIAMPPKKPKTTPKQAKFVEGVVRHGNLTKAALEAGYSANSARQMGSENLSKPYIREQIEARNAELKRLAQVHTEVITGSLVEIMQGSLADVFPENRLLQRARQNGVDRLIKKLTSTPVKVGEKRRILKDGTVLERPVIGEKLDLELYSRLDAIAQLRDNFGMKQEPRANTYEATRQAEVEKELEKIMQAEQCSKADAAKMLREALGSDSPLIPTVNKYVN